jgi:hypothetical protein
VDRARARRGRDGGTLLSSQTCTRRKKTREIDDMTAPRPLLDQDDESDLPDDLIESIEDTPGDEDDFGDETQFDEALETEEGLEQEAFIEPPLERDEDID